VHLGVLRLTLFDLQLVDLVKAGKEMDSVNVEKEMDCVKVEKEIDSVKVEKETDSAKVAAEILKCCCTAVAKVK